MTPGNKEVPAPGRELIRMEGVSKIYLTREMETHAIANVQLSVKSGEWLALVGPSGSGKSTLLSILGLLDTPSKGTYLLDGKPTTGLNAAQRALLRNQHIGFIFQSFNLIGNLTVWENVELPLTFRKMGSAERRERVDSALRRLGMSERAQHRPGQLSGGQQQRVAVARAVAGDPLVLLADEPTGNLDSQNSQMVMELLTELHKQGATICMVTHNLEHTKYTTRTVRMLDGQVASESSAEGAPAERRLLHG
jgi:putative ABC transport system ATP-binding protein